MFLSKKKKKTKIANKKAYLSDKRNFTRVDLKNVKYIGIQWSRIEPNAKFFNYKHNYYYRLTDEDKDFNNRNVDSVKALDSNNKALIDNQYKYMNRKAFRKISNFPKEALESLEEASSLTPAKDSGNSADLPNEIKQEDLSNDPINLEQNNFFLPELNKLYLDICKSAKLLNQQYAEVNDLINIMGNDSFSMFNRFVIPGISLVGKVGSASKKLDKYFDNFLIDSGAIWQDSKKEFMTLGQSYQDTEQMEQHGIENISNKNVIENIKTILLGFRYTILKDLINARNEFHKSMKYSNTNIGAAIKTVYLIGKVCKHLDPDMSKFCDLTMRVLTTDLVKTCFSEEDSWVNFLRLIKSYLYMSRNIIHTIAQKSNDNGVLASVGNNALGFEIDMLSDFTKMDANSLEFQNINFVEDNISKFYTSNVNIPSEDEKKQIAGIDWQDYQQKMANLNHKAKDEALKKLYILKVQTNYKSHNSEKTHNSSGEFSEYIHKCNFTFDYNNPSDTSKQLGFYNASIKPGLSFLPGKHKFSDASAIVVYPKNIKLALLREKNNMEQQTVMSTLPGYIQQKISLMSKENIDKINKQNIYEGSGKYVEDEIKNDYCEPFESLFEQSVIENPDKKSQILKEYSFIFDYIISSGYEAKGILSTDNTSDKSVNKEKHLEDQNKGFYDLIEDTVTMTENISDQISGKIGSIKEGINRIKQKIDEGKITQSIANLSGDNIFKDISCIASSILGILLAIGIIDKDDKLDEKIIHDIKSFIDEPDSPIPNSESNVIKVLLLSMKDAKKIAKTIKADKLAINTIETFVEILIHLSKLSSITQIDNIADIAATLGKFAIDNFKDGIEAYKILLNIFAPILGLSSDDQEVSLVQDFAGSLKTIISSLIKESAKKVVKVTAKTGTTVATAALIEGATTGSTTLTIGALKSGFSAVKFATYFAKSAVSGIVGIPLLVVTAGAATELVQKFMGELEIDLSGIFTWKDDFEDKSANQLINEAPSYLQQDFNANVKAKTEVISDNFNSISKMVEVMKIETKKYDENKVNLAQNLILNLNRTNDKAKIMMFTANKREELAAELIKHAQHIDKDDPKAYEQIEEIMDVFEENKKCLESLVKESIGLKEESENIHNEILKMLTSNGTSLLGVATSFIKGTFNVGKKIASWAWS